MLLFLNFYYFYELSYDNKIKFLLELKNEVLEPEIKLKFLFYLINKIKIMPFKLLVILMSLATISSYSQTTKEVENGLFVTFPSTPKYQANTQATSYVGESKNCIFMVMILRNQIPNYNQYELAKKKWTQSDVKKVEDSFLDNAAKGKLEYTGSSGIITEVKIGLFRGRKMEYNAINPVTGERGKRFTIMLLVRDKVVSFECFYLIENTISKQEKDKFLNSIKVK